MQVFIKLPFVIKAFVLSIFEWPFYTGVTVDFTNMLKKMLIFYLIVSQCYQFTFPKMTPTLTLSLLVSSADSLCKQIKPDQMSVLNWIQTVLHSTC